MLYSDKWKPVEYNMYDRYVPYTTKNGIFHGFPYIHRWPQIQEKISTIDRLHFSQLSYTKEKFSTIA